MLSDDGNPLEVLLQNTDSFEAQFLMRKLVANNSVISL